MFNEQTIERSNIPLAKGIFGYSLHTVACMAVICLQGSSSQVMHFMITRSAIISTFNSPVLRVSPLLHFIMEHVGESFCPELRSFSALQLRVKYSVISTGCSVSKEATWGCLGICPCCLPLEVFQAQMSKKSSGRATTPRRDYMFHVAWQCVKIPQEELEDVAAKRDLGDFWPTLISMIFPQTDGIFKMLYTKQAEVFIMHYIGLC